MSEVKLVATARSEFGKGAARRLRRAHQIPAVLYGHGTDPLHVALPGHETMLALKHANALFAIELDGEKTLAIAKDVQREPVRNIIEHVDLLIVKKGEKVSVEVHVVVVGEPEPGTIHVFDLQTLTLEAEATNLPQEIEVDVTGIPAGQIIFARDVKLPEGAVLVTDPDAAIISVTAPHASAADIANDAAVAELSAAQSAESAAEKA